MAYGHGIGKCYDSSILQSAELIESLGLRTVPLPNTLGGYLRPGTRELIGGTALGHLDFDKIRDSRHTAILLDMIQNAIINMAGHAAAGRSRESQAYEECIFSGIEHAQDLFEQDQSPRLTDLAEKFYILREAYFLNSINGPKLAHVRSFNKRPNTLELLI